MKPAAIYALVSSTAQADNGTSLHSQLDACRQYAAQHGYGEVSELRVWGRVEGKVIGNPQARIAERVESKEY